MQTQSQIEQTIRDLKDQIASINYMQALDPVPENYVRGAIKERQDKIDALEAVLNG